MAVDSTATDYARLPVTFHWIRRWGVSGNQETVARDLRPLRERFGASDAIFETFCPIERGNLRTGTGAPVNDALFVQANANLISSALIYTPGFLVQMDDS